MSDLLKDKKNKQSNKKNKYKVSEYVNVAVFSFIMFFFFIAMFFTTNGGYSELEKRDLAKFPEISDFTVQDFIDGKYFAKIDDFFSDNFVKRDEFIALSDQLKSYKGIESEIQITVADTTAPTKEQDIKTDVEGESTEKDTSDDEDIYSEAERLGDVLTMGDVVCEAYGYNKPAVDEYAEVIKKFGDKITTANVYNLLVPTHVEFALPAKYQKLSSKQEPIMQSVYENIGDKVTPVNVYDNLKKHKREYIYFRSDHHWTQLGAYYAYEEYCKTVGEEPFKWDDYETEKIDGFLGTLYARSKSKKLKDNPDCVEYKPVGGELEAKIYPTSKLEDPYNLTPYAKNSKGSNAYGVFLYADYPLTVIKNPEVKTGKKVAVIKESYGNPFAILLSQNYTEVHAIDIRGFKKNLAEYVKENEIDDVIFINNMIAVGSNARVNELKRMLK